MAGEGEPRVPRGINVPGDGIDPWLRSDSEDEFEALADLFLGEGAADESGLARGTDSNPPAKTRPLIEALRAREELTYLHRRSNLEDVFIKLTGRELRDG